MHQQKNRARVNKTTSNGMKKILLIEDDFFLIDLYATKLKESGFKVDVVKNGASAVKRIKEVKPDLILLDIILPEIDGWDILKSIHNDKKLKNIKVLILSNLGQKDEVEKGMRMGAVKYLIKAYYTPGEVVKEIKKLI